MAEILVFKTNVSCDTSVEKLRPLLDNFLKNSKWNFDLEDCDKILRVEASKKISNLVIALLAENGFKCKELPD